MSWVKVGNLSGRDGRDAEPITKDLIIQAVKAMPDVLHSVVADYLAANPPARGLDGVNGKSVTVDDVAPMIQEQVARSVAAIPVPKDGTPGKDGIGLAGAVVDRDGHLVLTMSDGNTKDVGLVVGKDGSDGLPGKSVDIEELNKQIADAVAEIPRPLNGKDGRDGISFDDLDLIFDQRGYVLRAVSGDFVKEWPLPLPWDAGVWQPGVTYPKGAGVTVKGAWWIAQRDTKGQKPGETKDWRMAVKSGKDGKDGKPRLDGKSYDE